jgi:hypothetical protein
MRYACLYYPAASNQGPPSQEHMAAMGALVEQMMKSGSLLVTEPLGAPQSGARVERSRGAFKVDGLTDRAGGYAILQAESRDACIALAKTFLDVAGDGACEIRQIVDM